jgi:hypothetical protein
VLRISGHAYLIYAFLGIDKRWNEFGNWGLGDQGASLGGLDHEDGIWISYVLHGPYRPRSAYD